MVCAIAAAHLSSRRMARRRTAQRLDGTLLKVVVSSTNATFPVCVCVCVAKTKTKKVDFHNDVFALFVWSWPKFEL